MTTVDKIAVALVLATAPAVTTFALLYTFTVRGWWREWIGRALFVSAWGLALLVDISLAYQWLGDDYAARDAVRLTVYTLVCTGAWLKLIALIVEKRNARREHR